MTKIQWRRPKNGSVTHLLLLVIVAGFDPTNDLVCAIQLSSPDIELWAKNLYALSEYKKTRFQASK